MRRGHTRPGADGGPDRLALSEPGYQFRFVSAGRSGSHRRNGDGLADSLGLDTTGDGWVDTVQRLQRVDTRQTQHSAAPAIADQERKRRAGRQFNIEVAQVGPKTRYFIYC